jgi:hypothetical protein
MILVTASVYYAHLYQQITAFQATEDGSEQFRVMTEA